MTQKARCRVATVAVALTLALVQIPASAHVIVEPDRVPKGSIKVLSFVVPQESDTTLTVGVSVEVPQEKSLAFVVAQPKSGWLISVEKSGGLVRKVSWRGGSVAPLQFDQFSILVGPIPKAKRLVFKVVQHLSDGTSISWDQLPPRTGIPARYPSPIVLVGPDASGPSIVHDHS